MTIVGLYERQEQRADLLGHRPIKVILSHGGQPGADHAFYRALEAIARPLQGQVGGALAGVQPGPVAVDRGGQIGD